MKLKKKKWWKWTSNILYTVVFIVLLVTTISVLSARASGGEPQLFGYQFKTVLSGSMEPTFQTGSIIVVKEVDDTTKLLKNDVITFKESQENVVTHRIIDVVNQGDSVLYYTQGDNNEDPDTNPVLSENVVAKYTGITIPFIGYFLQFASSSMGTAILLIIPGIILIGYSVFTIRSGLKELERKVMERQSENNKSVS